MDLDANLLKKIDITKASYNSFDAVLAEELRQMNGENPLTCHALKALPSTCKRYFYSLNKTEQQYVFIFVQHQNVKVNSYFDQQHHFVVREVSDPHYVNIFENPQFTYERMLLAIFADLFHLQEHTDVLKEFDHLLHVFEDFQHLLRVESDASSGTYSNKSPG